LTPYRQATVGAYAPTRQNDPPARGPVCARWKQRRRPPGRGPRAPHDTAGVGMGAIMIEHTPSNLRPLDAHLTQAGWRLKCPACGWWRPRIYVVRAGVYACSSCRESAAAGDWPFELIWAPTRDARADSPPAGEPCGSPAGDSQVLARGEAVWEALCAALDADPAARYHHPPAAAWTARDIYAHLARWQADTLAALEHLRAGQPAPQPAEDDDTRNARWAAADAQLTTQQARARCVASRAALLAALRALSAAEWERFGRQWAADVDGRHYQAHLAALTT
jgi:hypothetical protein